MSKRVSQPRLVASDVASDSFVKKNDGCAFSYFWKTWAIEFFSAF